ncbi:MAG: alpha/beta hydrolase [Pseudomonadota bacterium]
MRRVALVPLLLLAGCGGSAAEPAPAPSPPPVVHAGTGAEEVWTFAPSGPPRAVVVFLHGLGGPREATPANHRAWIDHLVAGGAAVIYPKYEAEPGDLRPMRHLLAAVDAAGRRLGSPDVPWVAIGFSRGGRLAVEYAASAGTAGLVQPAAVLSVFPGALSPIEENVGLDFIDPDTQIRILVGDADDVVAGEGAKGLLMRLRDVGFPAANIGVRVVRSDGGFTASHLAPLEDTPGARAAFWAPADALIADVLAAG